MNTTPQSQRTHIAFFGRRNVGKSSLVNAFTGRQLSIVSEVKGTTTDPVSTAMELLPLGPVMIIDTPGLDDEGELGLQRVKRTRQVLQTADIALVVTDATEPLTREERQLIALLEQMGVPHLLVRNKADLLPAIPEDGLYTSAATGYGIHRLKETVAALTPQDTERPPVRDLLHPGDTVVLVIPIDKAAPKGRLILPQQQVIRDILEAGAQALVCRDTELEQTLTCLAAPPALVITDSQVFGKVNALVPPQVPLTSFSVLMARCKGDLPLLAEGASAVDGLRTGDSVLIAEGCTHHRQCEDIGTVKLPNWIRSRLGCEPAFTFVSGKDFPEDLTPYRLVIHCGGCMLTRRQMMTRLHLCAEQGIPVTNYGILIARLHGILDRALSPLEGRCEI